MLRSLTSITWLVAAWPALGADVQLSGARFAQLLPPSPVQASPPSPAIVEGRVRIELVEGGIAFDARYRVFAPNGGPLDVAVAPDSAHLTAITFDGAPVATTVVRGAVRVAALLPHGGELAVRGVLDGELGAGRDLGLPQVPGEVEVRGDPVLAGAVALGGGRFAVAAEPLVLAPAPPARRVDRQLVLGEAAVGLTVGDAEVRGQAHLRWRIARGDLDRVVFRLPGAGADLDVTGPQVASWSRTGDQVEVVLTERERALVSLSARWTASLPVGDELSVTVPRPELDGTFRASRVLQLARDGAVEIVPGGRGYLPAASRGLPEWARGLVEGQPTAAFTGGDDAIGSLTVYRATPAQGPPTLIDVAQVTAATTEEGRVLMRAHYAVRNDRGAFLRLRPPPGLRVIGARVAGDTARISLQGDHVLLPLARSVETVEGLLSFPVEVTLLGEQSTWSRREQRPLALPTVDAPVAVSRATVYLPPAFRAVRGRDQGIVDAFTEGEGITYGFGLGDVRAAQADALFQRAVSSWMANEFDEAQGYVDELETLGGSSGDVDRLKSNLAYVFGGEQAEVADVAQARRVKDLARARAADDVVRQQKVLEEAEQKEAVGDYRAAAEAYGEARKIGGKLDKIAADEDADVAAQNVEIDAKLAEIRKKEKSAEPVDVVGGFDLSGVEVEGALTSPMGESLEGRSFQGIVGMVPDQAVDLAPAGSLQAIVVTESTSRRAAREPRPARKPSEAGAVHSVPSQVEGGVLGPIEPAVAVTASSMSVIVPIVGEPVLYQRLLLPADAADAVPVRARRTRRIR